MGYDPVNRRVLLFGGFEPLGYDNETWQFDSAAGEWSRLEPGRAPSPRAGHSMLYAPSARKFVLFGGFTSEGEVGDTWTFDPGEARWENVSPAGSPSRRAYHAMALHALSGKLVLYGGAAASAQLSDTWVYDPLLNRWSPTAPPDSPAPRYYHAMLWEPVSSRVLMFGGWSTNFNDETWTYDLMRDAWTRLVTPHAPSPRQLHSMAFDPVLRRVMLFGGWSGTFFNGETWWFDGGSGTWENATGPGSPSARTGHAMAYDHWNDLTVMFGGVDELGRKFDTWTHLSRAPGAAPKVVRTDPGAGERGVRPDRSVTVEFDREMAPEETARSVTVSPRIPSSRAVVVGRTLVIVHVADLRWSSSYTVTVGDGARSVDRARIEEPFTFRFTTADPPPAPPPAEVRTPQPPAETPWLLLLLAALVAVLVLAIAAWLRNRRADGTTPARTPTTSPASSDRARAARLAAAKRR
jgi:hypothetical protein